MQAYKFCIALSFLTILLTHSMCFFQVGVDCLLGESVTIGEKVSIKKSVIGNHCKIGEKVKITNCVIMDHVNIQERLVRTMNLLALCDIA